MGNKEKGILMWKYAMNYGVLLGGFWVFKYLFYIASDSLREFPEYQYLSDLLSYLYLYLLPIITLSLYYVLLKRFRDHVFGGEINYIQCILYSTLLFFFAALLEAVIVYIYLKFFITPQSLLHQDKGWLEIVLQSLFSQAWLDSQRETYGNIIILLSEIIKNVAIGFLLSLVYGIFVSRKNKTIQ